MKISRRRFLYLAAGAAVLPLISRTASALDGPAAEYSFWRATRYRHGGYARY
jgi:hypothetical protein